MIRNRILIGSEVALNAIKSVDPSSLGESFQFLATDVLSFILEKKGVLLDPRYEVLETSFAGFISSVRSGVVTGFDESFQYLVLYSIARDESTDLKVVVEDAWFDVNSDASGQFLSVSEFLVM